MMRKARSQHRVASVRKVYPALQTMMKEIIEQLVVIHQMKGLRIRAKNSRIQSLHQFHPDQFRKKIRKLRIGEIEFKIPAWKMKKPAQTHRMMDSQPKRPMSLDLSLLSMSWTYMSILPLALLRKLTYSIARIKMTFSYNLSIETPCKIGSSIFLRSSSKTLITAKIPLNVYKDIPKQFSSFTFSQWVSMRAQTRKWHWKRKNNKPIRCSIGMMDFEQFACYSTQRYIKCRLSKRRACKIQTWFLNWSWEWCAIFSSTSSFTTMMMTVWSENSKIWTI